MDSSAYLVQYTAPKKVYVHHFVQHVGFGFGKQAAHGDAGIVDKNVDAAEYIDGGFNKVAAVVFVAYVGYHGM
jgi:hypothetical protein